jgi:hypothetical protein
MQHFPERFKNGPDFYHRFSYHVLSVDRQIKSGALPSSVNACLVRFGDTGCRA